MGSNHSTSSLIIDNEESLINTSTKVANRIFQNDSSKPESSPATIINYNYTVSPTDMDSYLTNRANMIEKFERQLKEREQLYKDRINKIEKTLIDSKKAFENSVRTLESNMNNFLEKNENEIRNEETTKLLKMEDESRFNVLGCYKENLKTPINCAPLVDKFMENVSKRKAVMLRSH